MSKEITIFISSRFYEFRELRDKIIKERFSKLDVGLKLNMLDDREGIADARSPAIMSIEEAGDADIFILLLGETYKEVQDGEKSYTHQEYDTAIEKGLHILAFPIGDCYDDANRKLSTDDKLFREFQDAILINNKHTTAPFSSSDYDVDEMYEKIYNTLKGLIQKLIQKGLTKSIHSNGISAQLSSKLGKSTIIGRKKELQEIDQQLNSSNTLLLINGIGGVGKSNITSYYLHNHKEQFDYYGFFEGLDGFISELESTFRLKRELGRDSFLDILHELRGLEGKKLLVIDDVKETTKNQKKIEQIMALQESGYTILFTSREKIDSLNSFTLKSLEPRDAQKLFLKYCQTEEISKLNQILKYFDYHALFIELLAKTIQEEGYKLDFILQKFEKGELSKIELIDKATGEESTFNNILQELFSLQNLSEEYILLLKKISLLPSIEIEFSFLKRVIKNIRRGKVKFLVRRGWLINQGDNYKLHQIIKEFIWANHQPTLEEMDKIVLFFANLIKSNDYVQSAILLKGYLVYFGAIDDILNRVGVLNEKITEFWANLAQVYQYSGFYKKSLPFHFKVVQIREKVLGEEHPDTATSYNELANLYQSMGEYQKAEPLYLKALKIKEKVLGEEHPSTAISYWSLGAFYYKQEEFEKAYTFVAKAVEVFSKVLPSNHPHLINSKKWLEMIEERRGFSHENTVKTKPT